MSRQTWLQTLSQKRSLAPVRARGQANHDVLLFVHGYNNTFEDAARRTAQFTYDIGYRGVPVMYSWPAKGGPFGPLKYLGDEATARWAVRGFTRFVRELSSSVGEGRIVVVAHSMGSRLVTEAIDEMGASEARDVFAEVVLAAPDVLQDHFVDNLAEGYATGPTETTVYASSRDRLIKLSRAVHSGCRVGSAGDCLFVVPGVETIDASSASDRMFGHGYFAENKRAMNDVYLLLMYSVRASRRPGLAAQTLGAGRTYWRM